MQTIVFKNSPCILETASSVGKKEGEGPLRPYFDNIFTDAHLGEDSWEKAESSLQKNTLETLFKNSRTSPEDIDMIFGGDLLNQCIGSNYGLLKFNIPFFGLYGACSTFVEGSILAAMSVDGGFSKKSVAVTSSHFCSSERQFRFPLEYGGQRTPTSQWTVTGSGAALIGTGGDIRITHATVGRIVDYGIVDINNMGAAMAPAAASTIKHFFEDTNTSPEDYDVIYTGDLGYVGTQLLYELCDREGIDLRCRHSDCGTIIFDRENQDVHAGGSGCGCSASVLCSFIMHRFEDGDFKNILFMSTGALMSPTSSFQGESIPGIAHLLHIKND